MRYTGLKYQDIEVSTVNVGPNPSGWVNDWLSSSVSENEDRSYNHQLLVERDGGRDRVLNELRSFVSGAHEDVRRHLRSLVSGSLDPLGAPEQDLAATYPGDLGMDVLKSYFGEIMAGLIAEHFSPFRNDTWKVPTFLFRFHLNALQRLENVRQTNREPGPLPGRPGDDCLAFQRSETGQITKSLVAESKCTRNHDSHLINDGMEQLSQENPIPVDVLRLIEVLRDYEDEESLGWTESLRSLLHDNVSDSYERFDLLAYTYGQSPTLRPSWIDTNQPHPAYTAGRQLEAAEVHLENLEELVASVYQGG